MLALIRWLGADSAPAPAAHCVTDLLTEAILQFTNLLFTYLLTYILILEMQGRSLTTPTQVADFQNNMKLQSPPAYTLDTASAAVYCHGPPQFPPGITYQ